MISKNLIKYVRSLELKKVRKRERAFVAEGPKIVGELVKKHKPLRIIATEDWFSSSHFVKREDDILVTEEELRRVSFLQHPQQVVGVFPLPEVKLNSFNTNNDVLLALDGVQDPGNLGTILRIADWFGITAIVCSPETADVYNPKVVQASMGSIARVDVVYEDLVSFLNATPKNTPIFGTFLNGDNMYAQELSTNGIIIMGNEGKGISEDVCKLINRRLFIPSFPCDRVTAESLNVAVATAIVCAEFRRRQIVCNSV